MGPMWNIICFVMKGEAGFELEMENIDVGEDRLEALGEGRTYVLLADLIVMWSRGFLVRDVEWECMALKSGLLGLFTN